MGVSAKAADFFSVMMNVGRIFSYLPCSLLVAFLLEMERDIPQPENCKKDGKGDPTSNASPLARVAFLLLLFRSNELGRGRLLRSSSRNSMQQKRRIKEAQH